ncbi:MAG TPA: glycerol-3-phosphate 1-O-acyltransferase PlsY [Terriglobales bacterium]|nr:glycerol-3-phosphate 1-O-acyltransferase PlsY [Terriglobales bacterium]
MGRLLLTVAVVSYLLGSIPFGYLLMRIFRGVDVRTRGSGNIGATNVARTGSKGLAIATLLLDGCKGYCAVLLAKFLLNMEPSDLDTVLLAGRISAAVCALAAFFAILGHVFTVWLRFKGGKGVAVAAGAFAALAPRAFLFALAAFVVVVAVTRYVSLGSIVAAVSFPIFFYVTAPPVRTNYAVIFFTTVSALLIIIRHKDNIRRLLAGTENRLGKPA